MHEEFLAVTGEAVYEYVIERSKFIAASHYIKDESHAERIIGKVRQERRDATHNCYGYVTGEGGNIMRFHDDGEPSKTAGLPILEVIRGRLLKNTLVIVTRYFGGIKLGAGGLVRAYVNAASGVLDLSKTDNYKYCKCYTVTADYQQLPVLERLLPGCGAKILNRGYTDVVTVEFAVPEVNEQDCLAGIADFYKKKHAAQLYDAGYMSGFS